MSEYPLAVESIHPKDYRVLNLFRFLSSDKGYVEISYLKLTKLLGWSTRSRTVTQTIGRLRRTGLLEVKHRRPARGEYRPNRFTVTTEGHRLSEAWQELKAMRAENEDEEMSA